MTTAQDRIDRIDQLDRLERIRPAPVVKRCEQTDCSDVLPPGGTMKLGDLLVCTTCFYAAAKRKRARPRAVPQPEHVDEDERRMNRDYFMSGGRRIYSTPDGYDYVPAGYPPEQPVIPPF